MNRTLRHSLQLIALVWSVSATSASAQSNPAPATSENAGTREARLHFQNGVEYYRDGDYRAAQIEFERAYALQPHYLLLYNLGQVTYELRDYPAAERYFRGYLIDGGDEIRAERKAEVEADLKRLRGRIATIELRTNVAGAKLSMDDTSVGVAPLAQALRVSAGRRRIVAEHAGYVPVSKLVDVVGGDQLKIELRFGPPISAAAPLARSPQVPRSSGTSLALWTGIATGALAAGAAGMGIWAANDSSHYQDTLKRETTQARLDSLASEAKREALISDLLLGAAAVTGAITLVLLVTGSSENEPTPTTPGLAFDARGLQLSF
jgi:tetratricopeptide (TPR) repeat protein